MRPILAVLCAVPFLSAAVAAPAFAQGLNAGGLMRLPGVDPAETSPVKRLSKDARAWIEAERARQLEQPGDLVELAFEIETTIGPDIMKIAERERIDTRDLILVVMYDIMDGASRALNGDIRRLKAAPTDADLLAAKVARKAEIDARLAEIVKSQTVVSRSLVQND